MEESTEEEIVFFVCTFSKEDVDQMMATEEDAGERTKNKAVRRGNMIPMRMVWLLKQMKKRGFQAVFI